MADPFPLQAWAWAQQVPPEEKLVLLVLVDGEVPEPARIQQRTALGAHATMSAIQQLQRRGLIDAELKPVGP